MRDEMGPGAAPGLSQGSGFDFDSCRPPRLGTSHGRAVLTIFGEERRKTPIVTDDAGKEAKWRRRLEEEERLCFASRLIDRVCNPKLA